MSKPQAAPAKEQAFDPSTLKVKNQLTTPIISMAHVEELYCECLGEVTQKRIGGFGKGPNGEVDMVEVLNLETSQRGQLVVSAVLKSVFEQSKPVTGKRFLIKQGVKIEGKRYRPLDVYELD